MIGSLVPGPTLARRVLMVIAVLVSLLCLGTGTAAASPTEAELEDLEPRIQTLVEEHVGESTPGAMVAVVDTHGPLLVDAWGYADPVAGTLLTTSSRTPVASVSKVVSSLTALRLHHEGSLDLDADIRTGLPVVDRRSESERTPVTGWHLLTHHAGIAEPLLMHPDPEATTQTGPVTPRLEETPPILARPSGVGLHYSPVQGYDLLGAMIERTAGTGFEEAAIDKVLAPAGATQADFQGPGTGDGDVRLSTRDGDGWTHTSWAGMPHSPATTLTWSTEDAASLLHSLLTDDNLPDEVVAEALTTSVRPAHGGGGHTGVFFESWRADLPVFEHAGADGLAWLVIIPSAELGVFAAVTTEDPAAAELSGAIVDEVAQWAVDTGRAKPDPMPSQGLPALTPAWAAQTEPVMPEGAFHEQVFAGLGPELLLRTASGQAVVQAEGDDLIWGDRRLHPAATEGRWCDDQGCVAGVRTEGGTVSLLRSDADMLQQTLAPAPWWADLRFVSTAIAGALVLAVCALWGAARSCWRRRRGREVPAAVARGVAAAWSATSIALVLGTALLPGSLLTGDTSTYIASEGGAVWALRVGTAAQLGLGIAWLTLVATRWRVLSGTRRILSAPTIAVGLAASFVLVTWALPSV